MRYALFIGIIALVDILVLLWMMNKIAVLARKKGQSIWTWRGYALGIWILVSTVCIITAIPILSVMNVGLIYAWPLSLLGAFLGYGFVYFRLSRMPNSIK